MIALLPEIQVRIFCESCWLFFSGLLTCKRPHRCILRHASRLPACQQTTLLKYLALEQVLAASRSGGLRKISEEVMCDLVGDDDLMAHEEAVLEAVTGWIKAGGGEEGRGRGCWG